MMEQQRQQYMTYIHEHIVNVQKVWTDIQPLLTDEYWLDEYYYFSIDKLIKIHDASKFDDVEFHGYRQWFYPTKIDSINRDKVLFDRAWNRHQKRNPHHWEYWLLYTNQKLVPLDMPFEYSIEMLCDWTAMSYKFGDTPTQFYSTHSFLLSEHTEASVARWLPIFDKVAEQHNADKK